MHALDFPGHGRRLRETPCRRMDELVELVAHELLAGGSARIALYGHSMGGLVAFEVARWLRARALAMPEVLVVGGRRAPHLTPPYAPSSGLDDDQFVSRLLTSGALTAQAAASPGFRAHMLPSLRADIALLEDYRFVPQPPLEIPLVAIAGTADEVVTSEDVAAWSEHAAGGFLFATAPGGHFFHVASSGNGAPAPIHDVVTHVLPPFTTDRATARVDTL